MALLSTSQQQYYQGNNTGKYQFTSLNDVINYFMSVYVGENKIIPKARRVDVAFHAQRALQELSFDTLKSIKSQEIVLPPSLTMVLPHDYVNYTKVSFSDSSGIKRILYPTSKTSNPFSIKQEETGEYVFSTDENIVVNGDFNTNLSNGWRFSNPAFSSAWNGIISRGQGPKYFFDYIKDTIQIVNEELEFGHLWFNASGQQDGVGKIPAISNAYGCWQAVDVSQFNFIDFEATAQTSDQLTDISAVVLAEPGLVRVGLTSVDPAVGFDINGVVRSANITKGSSPNRLANVFDLGFLSWNVDPTDATKGESGRKTKTDIDVRGLDTVYIYIQSLCPWKDAAITNPTNENTMFKGGLTPITPATATNITHQKNVVDEIVVKTSDEPKQLISRNLDTNSKTWNNYKSHTQSELVINDYQDYENNVYWPNEGERYGLEPEHAQVNGSYYIDTSRGIIYFSSALSGQTIILDYISDGLGTESEMMVHKFAEEAMYKSIIYAILSTSSFGQSVAPRFKKEKFAAIRQAKIRLSNIKLEEITQILRGKSKHIKH
tara:strand:- start:13 stop:1656 length:1644 start_codon:yes stop_codon:yes gene_type:complete